MTKYSLWKNGTELLLRFTRGTKEEAIKVLNSYKQVRFVSGTLVLRDGNGKVVARKVMRSDLDAINGVYPIGGGIK